MPIRTIILISLLFVFAPACSDLFSSKVDVDWKKTNISIFDLLTNEVSPQMPQVLIFNEKNEIITHIKQASNIINHKFNRLPDIALPKNDDYFKLASYIEPVLELNINKFNVLLLISDEECLPGCKRCNEVIETLQSKTGGLLADANYHMLLVHQKEH